MPRNFEKLSDLIKLRSACPSCSKTTNFQLTTSVYNKNDTTVAKIENYLDNVLNPSNTKEKKLVIEFPPTINKLEIKELKLTIDFDKNIGLVDDIESAMNLFDLKLYCSHDIIGNAYEAVGSFDFEVDFTDIADIPRENGKYCLPLVNLNIYYERYNIFNLHLEDEKPNGNIIKIINDYHINKTSFSLAEVNLDGSLGIWKEKRIDLVDDSFFKFNNSEKIYSRINTIFLLK